MWKLNEPKYETTWSTCFLMATPNKLLQCIQNNLFSHNQQNKASGAPLVAMVLTLNRHDREPSSISTIVIDQVVGFDPQKLVALVQT